MDVYVVESRALITTQPREQMLIMLIMYGGVLGVAEGESETVRGLNFKYQQG